MVERRTKFDILLLAERMIGLVRNIGERICWVSSSGDL